MSAQSSTGRTPRKIAEILQAFFRLDAKAQEAVREQVDRLGNPRTPDAERARLEGTLATLLGAEEGAGAGRTVSRAERLTPAHRELLARMEQEEAAFAATLARLMAERQLTQAELAGRIGVGQSAIAMLLKRRCRPQRRTIGKLAEALGVPVEELWPGFHGGWRSGVM